MNGFRYPRLTAIFLLQFILSVAVISNGWVMAQTTYPIFKHITTANGLSNNFANCVLQDREGFYWISTTDGLNRFDGSAFKVFRNEKNNPNSLAHNLCNYLVEDDNGNIWVATYNGISVYKKKEGKFQNIYLQHPGYKPDILNRIGVLTKDDSGNIWIASEVLLWKYNVRNATLQSYANDPKDNTTISESSGISSLNYDKRNKGIWMSTSYAINFFDLSSRQFFHKKNDPKNWKIFELETAGKLTVDDAANRLWFYNNSKKVFCFFDLSSYEIVETPVRDLPASRSIQTDDKGRLWLSFWRDQERSLIFDPVTGEVDSSFLNKFHSRSALSPRFNHFYTDRYKNIWVSSSKGISIHNPSSQYFNFYELDLPFNRDDVEPFYILAIAPAEPGSFWIGCNKKGLYHFNTKTRILSKTNHPQIDQIVSCLYPQGDSILWFSTATTLYKLQCKDEKIIREIKSDKMIQFITGDHYGHIWLGDWKNGLYKLDNRGEVLKHYRNEGSDPGSLPHDRLICFANNTDELWVGMNSGYGFAKYDPEKDKFIHFNPRTNDSSGNEYGTINGITTGDGNVFMIGTHGGGVYLWNRKTNQYKQFNENDGIDGSFINSILPDKNGNYWISTSNGLNFLDVKSQKFSQLKIDFSFSTPAFISNGITAGNGNLVMFCKNKLLEINPQLYNFSETEARTLISSFKVFDSDQSASLTDSVIHLTYKQNFFSFEYSALKSNLEADARYSYKLEGFDEKWNDAGSRRYAAYTNVPAGSYRFLVKASNEKGEWSNDITSIKIAISPPFWKTWWFYSFCAVTIAMLLFAFYRYRINQLTKLLTMRTKISQDLHDEVASTLSGIRLYSEMAKVQLQKSEGLKAHQSLEVISTNAAEMTQNMSDIVWTINPNNDSFDKLIQKLKGYAMEISHAKGMLFHFEQKNILSQEHLDMQQRRNIYLVCKEAIHNAIKYSEAKNLELRVHREAHHIHILIADDGKGFDAAQSYEGNGLLNMKMRCVEIGASLLVNSEKNKGTQIKLTCRLN